MNFFQSIALALMALGRHHKAAGHSNDRGKSFWLKNSSVAREEP
jgi:hypothetical protein